jgi:hypothetical protein
VKIPFLELTENLLPGATVGDLAEGEEASNPAFSNRVSRSRTLWVRAAIAGDSSRILCIRAAIAGDSSDAIGCECKVVLNGVWEDVFEP